MALFPLQYLIPYITYPKGLILQILCFSFFVYIEFVYLHVYVYQQRIELSDHMFLELNGCL